MYLREIPALVSGPDPWLNTVRWAWLDWGPSGWLITLLQCFNTVGWVIRPVKTVARITYIVLAQTLNHAQSINKSLAQTMARRSGWSVTSDTVAEADPIYLHIMCSCLFYDRFALKITRKWSRSPSSLVNDAADKIMVIVLMAVKTSVAVVLVKTCWYLVWIIWWKCWKVKEISHRICNPFWGNAADLSKNWIDRLMMLNFVFLV